MKAVRWLAILLALDRELRAVPVPGSINKEKTMMKYWLDSLWGTVISGLILTLILHNIVRYVLGG